MSENEVDPDHQAHAVELPEASDPPIAGSGEDQALAVDAENGSDADSALGASINGSYSTSLRSSILHYKYEHGRRYHSYRDGEYPLPNDEAEQDRMDLLHHIWRMMLGGDLLRSTLNYPPQKILDVGTGTGIWAIEIAEMYPQAIVRGIDLSPIQPGWVPPNCKFYVDDAESEWAYSDSEHFDLIHGRSLGGSLANWPNFYRQVYQNLKPCGTLEMQEHEAWLKADDETMERAPWTTDWNHTLNDASATFGKKLNVAENHKMWMEEAGFVDVRDEVYKIPIGSWPKDKRLKEIGRYHKAEMLDAVEPYTLQLYTQVLGYSLEQTKLSIEMVKAEFRDPKNHMYINYHFIYGVKPEHE